MAIVIKSGLLAAVNTVQAYLTANSVTATVQIGWKKRPQQVNQSSGGGNRVVFIPSAPNGVGGMISPPRFPGRRNVRDPDGVDPDKVIGGLRELVSWERKVQIAVWAVDLADRENESAQIEATESLFEWVVRAIHGAPGAFASLEWGEVIWTQPQERAFGLELVAGLTFKHPIFDKPTEIAYPDSVTVSRGEYDATITAPDYSGDT